MARRDPLLPERRDRRPARVPRPDAQPAVHRFDGRPRDPGDDGGDRPDRDPLPRSPDGHPDRASSSRGPRPRPALGGHRRLAPQRAAGRRADPAWKRPFAVEVVPGEDAGAGACCTAVTLGGIPRRRPAAERPGGHRSYRTLEGPNSARSQILSVASFGIGVLDWSAAAAAGRDASQFVAPTYQVDSINTATDGAKPLDAQQAASRGFLGIVFVVLLFITIVIYGMWVATGVAAGEEQPGDGADDQRGVSAPDADRQGRRDRGGRADPVPRDRAAGAASCSRSRTGSPRRSSGRTGRPGRRWSG